MSTPLLDVTHTLTRDHLRSVDGNIAMEEALLDTLKSLINPSGAGNGSSDGGGSGGGSRPPINLDALDTWTSINRTIREGSPYGQHPAVQKADIKTLLRGWVNHTTDPVEALRLYELCDSWVRQIREILEPSKRMPLSGYCPECGKSHVETLDEDGVARYDTAIVAFPGSVPVFAQCRVCETKWEGAQLHDLGARLAA